MSRILNSLSFDITTLMASSTLISWLTDAFLLISKYHGLSHEKKNAKASTNKELIIRSKGIGAKEE